MMIVQARRKREKHEQLLEKALEKQAKLEKPSFKPFSKLSFEPMESNQFSVTQKPPLLEGSLSRALNIKF
jgi:hypothetical protein